MEVNLLNKNEVSDLIKQYYPATIINILKDPYFDNTHPDLMGDLPSQVSETINLLEAITKMKLDEELLDSFYYTKNNYANGENLWIQIGSYEAFGSIQSQKPLDYNGYFHPRTFTGAIHASANHFLRVFGYQFDLNYKIILSANPYGPRQNIHSPLMQLIEKAIHSRPIFLHNKGQDTHTWIAIQDYASAIWKAINIPNSRRVFTVGSKDVLKDIELIEIICEIVSRKLGRNPQPCIHLVQNQKVRRKYNIKLIIETSSEIQYTPCVSFREGLEEMVDWYLKNYLKG